ncbi:hypothetical protein M0Q50_06330 [bacterium]|jgi:hypothetical protein|nr:hypothetical protein [bacterium]
MLSSFKSYKQWVLEARSGEIFNPTRNKPIIFDPQKHPDVTPEMFDLINTAYAEIGGHIKVKQPSDILKNVEWDYWEGTDIHGTKDFDLIMFGTKTHYGIKFSGVGHDGEKDTKKAYLEERGKDLHKLGYYIEVSGKLAEILINKYNVPIVNDEEEVRKVLPYKTIEWVGKYEGHSGDGWYTRDIGDEKYHKILLGRPKI